MIFDFLFYQNKIIIATPPAPAYLTVYPSSVLALVTWKLNSTGGYPIKSISVIYQEVTDDWNDPAWHRTFPEELEAAIVKYSLCQLCFNESFSKRKTIAILFFCRHNWRFTSCIQIQRTGLGSGRPTN